MRPLFKVIFTDGTEFNGGTIQETKWKEIPTNKQIKELRYLLADCEYLILTGYDKYYQYIECTQDFYGGLRTDNFKIQSINLFGRKENKVTQFKIKGAIVEQKELNIEDLKLNPEFWR